MEKITYLVTNYNNGRYLSECLDSVLAQRNHNWECIVIDDCSTDDSLDILNKYSNSRIKVVQNVRNLGQIHSTLRIMSMASTDIVGLLDSDDTLHPDATGEVLKAYSVSKDIGLVSSNCIQYDEAMEKILLLWSGAGIPLGVYSSMIDGYITALKTFRISCYKKTTGYDTAMLCGEDLDLIYKLEEVCRRYYINQFLYNRRNVNTSKSKQVENWLIGIKNHELAKLRALERRNIKKFKLLFGSLYVKSEYRYKLCKFKKKKLMKTFFLLMMRISKFILLNTYLKPIQY